MRYSNLMVSVFLLLLIGVLVCLGLGIFFLGRSALAAGLRIMVAAAPAALPESVG
jgi:hypothetical protein